MAKDVSVVSSCVGALSSKSVHINDAASSFSDLAEQLSVSDCVSGGISLSLAVSSMTLNKQKH